MHSKWQIWDYFSSFDKFYLAKFNGVLGINTFDPLCLKMVKDYLVRGAEGRIIHYKMASEVTKNWIDTEFKTLSLFGGSDCFFIHQAHELKVDVLEMIGSLSLDDRFIILSFENENSSWKKNLKDSKFTTLTIESPRFWEIHKLLDFVCSYFRLPLSYESKTWILDSLENDLGSFYNTCGVLKLNYPEAKEVSLAEVKSLFSAEKLDQFALASLFARKKFLDFYEKVVILEGDFEKMRFFFNFMQSHLIKLADVAYLNQKPRLTQYDKDLQSTSKLWKNQELISEVERFNRWEVQCKKKDQHLWHEIRETHLIVMTRL